MRFSNRLFGSRVALRVFLSFVFVGLLPISVLALLATSRIADSLERQTYEQLDVSGRAVGQQLLDRLLIAHDALRLAAGDADVDSATGIIGSGLMSEDGRWRTLDASTPASPERVLPSGDKPRLSLGTGPDAGSILIATRLPDGIAVGKLDPSHLWRVAELLPYGIEMCVVEPTTASVLFCDHQRTPAARADIVRRAQEGANGEFAWSDDGDEWLAVHWQLFLPSRFEAEPWSVIVARPAALAREPLRAFNQAFIYALIFSLLATALLSAYRIRHTLEPIEKLVAGTKKIALRQFDTQMTIDSRDEFGELGDALNRMAKRLGQQFDALETFAEIDRLILSSVSIEQVLEDVLARARVVVPDCRLSVLIIDTDQAKLGRVYSQPGNDTGTEEMSRTEIGPEFYAWLLEHPEGAVGATGRMRVLNAELPLLDDTEDVTVVPISIGDQVRGAVVAQFADRRCGPDELDVIRELTGRLAVAVSAADRERELFERAHFDSLTGLPNRQLCRDRLRQAIAQARREGHQLAVLFIDLDRFKNVNDSLGHTFGDELLKEAAIRLTSCLRDTDTAARLGGDEYVVILPHIYGPLEVEAICAKLVGRLSVPYQIGDHEAFVSASIGAAVFPDDGTTAEELLRCADTAMYSAKDAGRGRSVFFTQELDHRVRERLSLLGDLRVALEREQFQLVYQPQIDLQTGQPVCAEALLRWRHPARGWISPGVFIPLLEDTDLVEAIGRWVVERALSNYRSWLEQGAVIERVSVNLAGRQLLDRGLADFVQTELKRNQLDGSRLELELTEHNLVADFDQANRRFRELRGLGVRVAIDDFGTGYSSLGYLQELSFDCLKIDRVFVNGLPESRSKAIVEAVLTVAHALGKEVVAEGVETAEQHARLKALGCDSGQGYFFAHPMPADDCREWVARYDASTLPTAKALAT